MSVLEDEHFNENSEAFFWFSLSGIHPLQPQPKIVFINTDAPIFCLNSSSSDVCTPVIAPGQTEVAEMPVYEQQKGKCRVGTRRQRGLERHRGARYGQQPAEYRRVAGHSC